MHRSMPPAQPHRPAHARGVGRAGSGHRGGATKWLLVAVVVVGIAGGTATGVWLHARTGRASPRPPPRTTTTTMPVTTLPPTTTQPTVASALTPCTPATVTGGVYAVG